MPDQKTSIELTLDEQRTHTLFGNHDENLRMIEDAFGVKISSRGNEIFVGGTPRTSRHRREADRRDAAPHRAGLPAQEVGRRRPACASCATSRDTNLVDFFTDDAMQAGRAPRRHAAQHRPEDLPAGHPGQRHRLRHRSGRHRQDLPRRRRRRRRARTTSRSSASSSAARPSKRASASASCPATSPRRSIPTCARCTTRSTTSSASRKWRS